MKKILVSAACVIAAVLIFGAGFYTGVKSIETCFGVTELSNAFVELIPLQMHIEQLDRDDNVALRGSLHLEQDGAIMKTYQLLDKASNQEHIKKAKGWLTRIANYRLKHPATYPSETKGIDREPSLAYVNAILAEFATEKPISN